MPSEAPFPTRIAFAEAAAIIKRVASSHRLPVERVALTRAHGRVLAVDVVAVIPQPVFTNSAMDGFALRHGDLPTAQQGLELVGEQFAGHAVDLTVGAGQCMRITTGAPLPSGADTVVMKENTRIDACIEDGAAIGRVHVLVMPGIGQHVRCAGEDSAIGDHLLRAGDVLTPARIALLASQGIAEVEVARKPTVAVFTTGDELVEPGLPLARGQIYNSNRELIMGLLRAEGLEPVAWPTLPDDPAQLTSALRHAGHAFDVVITCGAVSAGEKDHIPALLQAEASIAFWKVRMKPGMPLLFAEGGGLGDALFLCLPGNPVSVLATWLTLGRGLIDQLQGRAATRQRWLARLVTPWSKQHERLEFLRGRLGVNEAGHLQVAPNPADGSHRMLAAAESDALIILDEGVRDYPQGAVVELVPY